MTNFYNNRQLRKLKFEARIAEQRAIDKLVHYITWEKKKVLGIGDCSKTTGFKSLSPGGPIKKIKRHAVKKGYHVSLVDEYNTSKKPACCFRIENAEMKCITDKDRLNKGKSSTTVHGLRICSVCRSTWNRDFSAGINIWYNYYNVAVKGDEKHPAFCSSLKKNPIVSP